MKRIFAGLIILLSLTASGAVYNLENIPNPKVVDSRTYVSNPDRIIRNETVRELNILLDSLEKATRTEVAVVLVESIGDENNSNFGTG